MQINAGNGQLTRWIRERIGERTEKAMPFREYMEACLYHPEYGYYTSDRKKVGKDGDFYTSPAIGGIMGGLVAKALVKLMRQAWEAAERVRIVEWGAGTGQLAAQLMDELQAAYPDLYERLEYVIIEKSVYHSRMTLETLAKHDSHVRVTEASAWKAERYEQPTAVISNELLDAFAVHRVRRRGDFLMELYVGWDEGTESFFEAELPCTNTELTAYLEADGIRLLDGQTAELNLEAAKWIKEMVAAVGEGILLTIDYGDTAEECYAAHRMNGTLVCYRNHTAGDRPFEYAGLQDMTSHVNFTACIRAGSEAGVKESRLLTQKQFLLEAGILEMLQEHRSADPFGPEAKRNRAIRQLLLSDQLSELFKVLIQTIPPKVRRSFEG